MKEKKKAIARAKDARISLKHAVVLCRVIKGKQLEQAKKLLEQLAIGKQDIDGKHYSKAAKKLLELLNAAEANATQKDMETSKLYVAVAKPSKGRTFIRPRTRTKLRGMRAKSTNVEIVLEER